MRLVLPSALALASLVASCGGASCPVQPHTDPNALLSGHRASRAGVQSMRAEARVEQWGKQGRVRGTVMMFVERPNRVRFDAMTQFGPAAILTSDGERFALTDFDKKQFLTGPTCPINIERLLGIPLAGDDVAQLLFGDVPSGGEQSRMKCDDGEYIVESAGPHGTGTKYVFTVVEADRDEPPTSQRTRLVRVETRDPKGKLVWRATFDDYRTVRGRSGSAVMPFDVRIEHPSRKADTRVRFQRIDLGVAPPAGAFVQTAPPGMPSTEVVCD